MRLAAWLLLLAPLTNAQSTAVQAALAGGSYFPLDVGDRWVYRVDYRFVTATYETWRIDRTTVINGNTYAVFAIEGPQTFYYEMYYRADPSGKIYTPLANGGEQLFLDPTGQSSNATLKIVSQGGSAQSALGTFLNTLSYSNPMPGGLEIEKGILVPGLGLLTSTSVLETGSSGGPTEIRTLVEANVAGGIVFPAPVSGVQLGIDSLTPDVTGKNVTNCAIPCYFAACYIAGADPPGTYKPCSQVRVSLTHWPASASHSVLLQLIAPDGSTPFNTTLTLDASPSESVSFAQVPLYSAPNVPLASGAYQLLARSSDGVAQTALSVQIH